MSNPPRTIGDYADYREARYEWEGSEFPPGMLRIICNRRSGVLFIEMLVKHGDTQVASAVMMTRAAFVAKLAEAGVIP